MAAGPSSYVSGSVGEGCRAGIVVTGSAWVVRRSAATVHVRGLLAADLGARQDGKWRSIHRL